MSKKAIKIDLSTFFDDERRLSCVLVDPNWESVACLQKRIEHLFNVDSVRFLSDGCFLPPQESIEILKFCTEIKAFVPKESKESYESRKKKRSEKLNNIQKLPEEFDKFDQQNADGMQKKRKHKSLQCSSILSCAKRSKNSNKNGFLEITNENEEVLQEIENNKSKIKVTQESGEENQSVGLKPQNTENSSYVEKNTLSSVSSAGQYKGHHSSTPKQKSEMVINSEDGTLNNDKMDTESREILVSCDNVHNSSNSSEKNPFKKPKSIRAHIYFNESGEMVSPSAKITKSKSVSKKDEEPKTIVIFRCPLSDVTNDNEPQKPRIFRLISKNIAKQTPKKQVVEIQEQIILPTHSKQTVTEGLRLSNEKTDVSQVEQKEIHETTTETDKTDSLNEQGSFNNTIIPTENEKKDKDIANDLKQSQNEETKDISTPNETESEQKSIMSVDCVDLSIDLDNEDIEVENNKTKDKKLMEDVHEKHDLTADDEKDDSSASDVEEIIDLNETEDTCSTFVNNSMQRSHPFKDIIVDKILPFSNALTRLPNADDIIVFKVPYLNEKKKVVNTNFMAGKVEYINKRTKSIKILIIDGVSELCHIPNQFICNPDDSQDYIKYIQLKFKDMCEAKLYSNA